MSSMKYVGVYGGPSARWSARERTNLEICDWLLKFYVTFSCSLVKASLYKCRLLLLNDVKHISTTCRVEQASYLVTMATYGSVQQLMKTQTIQEALNKI